MDFLVFSDDWGRHPTTCEHLFRALLPKHRVIWVNTIGTRSPQLSLYDLRRTLEKIRAYSGTPSSSPLPIPNLTVLSPAMVPFNQWGWCRKYNRRTVRKAVQRAIQSQGFENYVVLTSLPTAGDFFLDHAGQTKVYYCVDDFEGMPGVNRNLIRTMEQELIARTDIHLVTAKPLGQKFNDNAHYLPHAVDFDHFQGTDRVPLPREPKSPVIGFFGHLGAWIDIPLLHDLIQQRQDWTFLFVGSHDVDVSSLQKQPNVIWTGPVSYDALPGYGRWFDVGLIPYRLDDPRMSTVNPVKLREYLALGLPVVSIPLPEIESLDSHIYTAQGAAGFEDSIQQALGEDNQERRQARLKLARENSWVDRGQALIHAIQKHT